MVKAVTHALDRRLARRGMDRSGPDRQAGAGAPLGASNASHGTDCCLVVFGVGGPNPTHGTDCRASSVRVETRVIGSEGWAWLSGTTAEALRLQRELIGLEGRSLRARVRQGRLLMDVRASLPRGRWLPWLAEVGIHDRQAQRRMQLAEAVGDEEGRLSCVALRVVGLLPPGDGDVKDEELPSVRAVETALGMREAAGRHRGIQASRHRGEGIQASRHQGIEGRQWAMGQGSDLVARELVGRELVGRELVGREDDRSRRGWADGELDALVGEEWEQGQGDRGTEGQRGGGVGIAFVMGEVSPPAGRTEGQGVTGGEHKIATPARRRGDVRDGRGQLMLSELYESARRVGELSRRMAEAVERGDDALVRALARELGEVCGRMAA